MAEAFILSKKDRDLLADMVRREVNERINKPSKSTRESRWEDESHQAPEIYVARVPQPGIPALTVVNPGWDKIFSRVCDIHQLERTSTSNDQMVLKPMEISEPVFNVSQDIVDSLYVIIYREKGGRWVASRPVDFTGTGSGTGSGTGQPGGGAGPSVLCCAEVCDTTGGSVTLSTTPESVLFDSISPVFSEDAVFLLNPFLGELTINVEGGGDFAISFMIGTDTGTPTGVLSYVLQKDNGTETWNDIVCPNPAASVVVNIGTLLHQATSPVILISLLEGEKIRVRASGDTSGLGQLAANKSFLSICKICCPCNASITKADTGTGTGTEGNGGS